MADKDQKIAWVRSELLSLLSISATLSGLCITSVTLLHTDGKSPPAGSIADDMLAASALLFLVCMYMIFNALRAEKTAVKNILERIIDPLFTLAMTIMVAAGFIMVYTVW